MDKCGICSKSADQLFETGNDGVYACFKCQPLVPEVTIGDNGEHSEASDPLAISGDNEEENSDDPLYCGICHKSFQKSMQLQNHLRNHRAERRFVCTYCNKAFSQSNNLRAHLRIHTNERPFKCAECGKAFTQVTNLNNHVRLHTGERPFVCPEPGCNKAYAQVTNLNQHRKRHLSGRPVEASYDCTVCGEQFQQRNHMYNHRRAAHGEARAGSDAEGQPRRAQPVLHDDDHDDDTDRKSTGATLTCVFSSCGQVLGSPREHTEHLLRAHQLRVLATGRPTPRPPRRGRPPKMLKVEHLDPKDIVEFHEVKITKQPQYLPKLKVQNLFQ